jgi:hypothetical protein
MKITVKFGMDDLVWQNMGKYANTGTLECDTVRKSMKVHRIFYFIDSV